MLLRCRLTRWEVTRWEAVGLNSKPGKHLGKYLINSKCSRETQTPSRLALAPQGFEEQSRLHPTTHRMRMGRATAAAAATKGGTFRKRGKGPKSECSELPARQLLDNGCHPAQPPDTPRGLPSARPFRFDGRF